MSSDKELKSWGRLRVLVNQVIEGGLTKEEAFELAGILESSDAAREYYVRCLSIDCDLASYWRSSKRVDFGVRQQGPIRRGVVSSSAGSSAGGPTLPVSLNWIAQRGSMAISGILLAASIVVLMFAYLGPRQQGGRVIDKQAEGGTVSRPANSPRLVSMTACVWRGGSERDRKVGESMAFGEVLDLVQGIAELNVSDESGGAARVRLEGPASVYVRSDGQLGLRFGLLTADVDIGIGREGRFSLETPMGNIVAHSSSSIGVIARGPKNEVHVFEGDVVVEQSWSEDGGTDCLTLNAGEAAQLASMSAAGDGAEAIRFDAQPNAFTTKLSMGLDRLNVPGAYVDQVIQDNPRVYWRFEEPGSIVRNEIKEAGETAIYDTHLNGNVSWRGFGENHAVEFGLTSTPGIFVCPDAWPRKELDSYAIEMWVKPNHYHNGALLAMVAPKKKNEKNSPHGVIFQVGGPYASRLSVIPKNRFRYLHRSPPSTRTRDGTSCNSKEDYKVRLWQHVVANKTRDHLELYIDGELVSSEVDDSTLLPGLKIVVGQLYPDDVCRPYIGQVDEVAIYERSLDPDVIKQHYELIKE